MERLKKGGNENPINVSERMNKIANEYPGIWLVSKDETSHLEKMIEIISQEEELTDELIAKSKLMESNSFEITQF